MAAGTRSITPRWLTFSERMRGTWFVLKLHWLLLAASVTALWSTGHSASFKVTSPQPGKSVTVTVNGGTVGSTWTAASGTHSILAWVDDVNRIPNEIDETNNQYTESLTTGTTGQPDLIVTDIAWNPANPAPGNAVTFSATIKNQGTAATPAGVIHGVAFQIDGAGTSFWSDNYTTSIPAGSSVTVTVNGGTAGTTWTAPPSGTHTVLAWVDDINRITNELNENNNQYTENLTIGITGQPDLIVTDITLNPSNPAAGTGVTFAATIKNQGIAATPNGVIHGVAFQIDNGGTTLWSDNYTTSIPAGSTVTITVNGGTNGTTWTAVTGTHAILAWVDDMNRFTNELNENNNTLTKNFTV